jgi:hypothetical protein
MKHRGLFKEVTLNLEPQSNTPDHGLASRPSRFSRTSKPEAGARVPYLAIRQASDARALFV